MEHEFEYFVGIDWADEAHQVHVCDGRRRVVGVRVVKHDGEGIAALATWLATLATPANIAVAIETPRGAVVEMLVERGFAVFHLNPKQLDRFRDRHTVAGAKDDRRDAMVLADSLRTDMHLYRRVKLLDDDLVALRELLRAHDEIDGEIRANSNRLRELLLRYYPQVLQLCSAVDERWVWDLLAELPTPASAASHAARAKVAAVLSRNRIRKHDADAVLQVLRQPPVSVSPATVAAASAHARLLLPRLQQAEAQRRQVERDAAALVRASAEPIPGQQVEHRDAAILLSLPGVGWKGAATMLVEASEALAARDYHALRLLSGVAPVTRQTGKNKKGLVSMRRAANPWLREAAYHWARVATQHDQATRAQYAALRARGHGHPRALRGVADRNMRLAIAMLRDGTLYDPARGRKASEQLAAK